MSRSAPSTSLVRVLLVDDMPEVRMLLRMLIDATPFQVVAEAANGAEAIATATAIQPDVVVLDLDMPVMSGREALPRLRAAAPLAKIIVFSGSLDACPSDLAMLGAYRFVPKGGDPTMVIRAIDQAMTPHGSRDGARAHSAFMSQIPLTPGARLLRDQIARRTSPA